MSGKKIGHWEANRIADKVSAKAFEHIIKPMKDKRQDLAQDAYDKTLRDLKLSPNALLNLSRLGIIVMSSHCSVEFMDGEDNVLDAHLGTEQKYNEAELPKPYITNKLCISSAKLVELAKDLAAALNPLLEKRRELCLTIKRQIEGRSVSYVLKNWPEITPFVHAEMGMNVEPMIIPFEDLIKRYLPALPAPAAKEAA